MLTVALTLGLSATAFTQEKGERCAVLGDDLPVRQAPPDGPFYKAGDKVGVAGRQDSFVVKEIRRVKTLYAEYIYAFGEVVDANTKGRKLEGWIYVGEAGGKLLLSCRR